MDSLCTKNKKAVEEKIHDNDDDEETMSQIESLHRLFQLDDVPINVLSDDEDEDEEIMSKIDSQHRLFQSDDVVINVLSKLPVKTLLRFRCVCKRWRYLISDDPYFFQLHSQHSKSKPLLLFSPNPSKRRKMARRRNPRKKGLHSMFAESMDSINSFKVKFKSRYGDVIPTRFDLVCITDGWTAYICNPSTQEFIKLPQAPWSFFPVASGFGYVESTDEYKVVRLTDSGYAKKCYVFTLGRERRVSLSSCSSSSAWTWREVVYPPIPLYNASDPAFVNGAIYWIIYRNLVSDIILAFDVESEDFRFIPIPEDRPPEPECHHWIHPVLIELKGLLAISYTKDSKMEVWILKDRYCRSGNDCTSSTWVKEYSINLNLPPHLDDQIYCFHPEVEVEFAEHRKVLIEKYARGVGYYGLQTKRLEGLLRSGKMEFGRWSFYVESLRSLKQTISTG